VSVGLPTQRNPIFRRPQTGTVFNISRQLFGLILAWKIPWMRRSAESALANVSLLVAVTSLYILVALGLALVFL
jgi:hypothetical protein